MFVTGSYTEQHESHPQTNRLLLKNRFNITFYPFARLTIGLFSVRPTKIFYASHMSVAYVCKICNSSVGNFHLPHLNLSLLVPYSFVSIPPVKHCFNNKNRIKYGNILHWNNILLFISNIQFFNFDP